MQDPTQDKQENTEENTADANGAEKETVDTSAEQENAAEENDAQSKEEELDPWEALELEAAKWKDQAIRNAAELDNYRKRMAREKQDAVRYGNQRLLEELLPVLDNFNMGMQAAAQEEGSMLYMGMDMVQKQITEFLSSQSVEEIPADKGSEFDPNLHEALSQEASDDVEDGKIIRVMRKGYRIGERLLRPSNVIVAQAEETASEPESTEDSETSTESE